MTSQIVEDFLLAWDPACIYFVDNSNSFVKLQNQWNCRRKPTQMTIVVLPDLKAVILNY